MEPTELTTIQPDEIEQVVQTIELSQDSEDYAETVVPLEKRSGAITMTLFWVTMAVSVPITLEGFKWYHENFSLEQVCISALTGSLIVFLYTASSAYLGVITGKTYGVLSRIVFGTSASKLISGVWSGLFIAWYALFASMLAQELAQFFKLPCPLWMLAAALGIIMSVNNVFGFRGVVNFARFLAGPILIAWVGLAFYKATATTGANVIHAASPHHMSYALPIISSFVIGASMWGNEPDFWRFGKPGLIKTAIPVLLAVVIGAFLFPITGWMVASHYNISDMALSSSTYNTFSFGQFAWIATFTLATWYFANNDGNLYGAINGLENILRFKRRYLITGSVVISAILAAWLSCCPSALDTIASFNAFLLPCVTLIMLFEFFVAYPLLGADRFLNKAAESTINMPALCALIAGWVTGVIASGILPQCSNLHTGVWPLYPWITSFCVYGVLRTLECRTSGYQLDNRRP